MIMTHTETGGNPSFQRGAGSAGMTSMRVAEVHDPGSHQEHPGFKMVEYVESMNKPW